MDLRDAVAELLQAEGQAEEDALRLAFAVAEAIRAKWKGIQNYIPKGLAWELSKRDREIYRRYRGGNKIELCREYKISEQRLYQILAKVRAEEVARRQKRLF